MTIRNILLAIAGLLLVLFTGLNWSAMTAPTTLSLVFAQIQAPLGLLMLGMLLLVAVGAALMVTLHQTQMLMESRRMEKNLAAQRELADKAELSRFTQMQSHLDGRLNALKEQIDQQHAQIEQAIQNAQRQANHDLGDEARSLAAQMGQMEDRLSRWMDAMPAPALEQRLGMGR